MTRLHGALAFVAATAGLAAIGAGSPIDSGRMTADIAAEQDDISAPQLAERLMRGDPSLHVFDLRTHDEYDQLHIPSARQASIETLAREQLPLDATIVLYAEGATHAAEARARLRLRGYRHVFVLREGLYAWIGRVLEPRLAVDATAPERAEFERAAELSRFFGGVPRAGVARADVPVGYWTGGQGATAEAVRQAVATVRRRGC